MKYYATHYKEIIAMKILIVTITDFFRNLLILRPINTEKFAKHN